MTTKKYLSYYKGQEIVTISFNPKSYKTAESAAKAFYEALKPIVIGRGHYIETELYLFTPEETAALERGRYWYVMWEAGPCDWGIIASSWLYNRRAGWYTEPYYSFDVGFVVQDS